MFCKKTTKRTIALAAKARFLHYGYGKTTMAEVARDCKMSPANLYRYFPSKLDIAVAIAREVTEETLEALREVARRPGMTASARLQVFFRTVLRATYAQLAKDEKLFEMAQHISSERPEFANERYAAERAILSEVLSAGNASGEFNIPDVVYTAEMMQSALMKFAYPQLWSKLPMPALERELEGVLSLLLRGICCVGSAGTGTVAAGAGMAPGRPFDPGI